MPEDVTLSMDFNVLSRRLGVGLSVRAVPATLIVCGGISVSAVALSGFTLEPRAARAEAPAKVVRIGYQKSGTVLISLKQKQSLEKALKGAGTKVQWAEFTAGLPMVEALNAGAIDLGYVGEAPPIFAQAASGSITRYVAYDPYGPKAEGIIVRKDSGINRLQDLKGKKIAVQKGSNTHYLVVKALAAAKLKPSQVEIIYLKPSDARAAFERGDVNAWAVWDPYLAAAEAGSGGRLLTNARGLAPNLGYYLASSTFIARQPATLKQVLQTIRSEARRVAADPSGTARFLAPVLGLEVKVLTKAEQRRTHDALPMNSTIVNKQQDVADTFRELQLIPKPIKVQEAVWKWN